METDNENNRLRVSSLVEKPELTAELTALTAEVKAGTVLPAVVSIRNAAHIAAAAESRAEVCIHERGDYLAWGCMANAQPLRITTAGASAGEVQTDTLDFTIPLVALRHPDHRMNRDVIVCADIDKQIDESEESDSNCARATVTVLPNFEAVCTVVATSPGQTLTGTFNAGDCDLEAGIDADVYSFTATANTTYTLGNPTDHVTVTVYDARGTSIVNEVDLLRSSSEDSFSTASDGTFYIVVDGYYSSTPGYSLTFTQP